MAGLDKARGYLETIYKNHPSVSWADLIQLASATAIEMAGASVCWNLDVDGGDWLGVGLEKWGGTNNAHLESPRIDHPLICVSCGRWPSDSHEVWPCLGHWP